MKNLLPLSFIAILFCANSLVAQPFSMLKDISSGTSGSDPEFFVPYNNNLYFTANNELWKTDKTEAGTTLVKSLNNIYSLINVNSVLYFFNFLVPSSELWKSDGTTEGTVKVASLPGPGLNFSSVQKFINVNGTLYFVVTDQTSFTESLWKSDGTQAGTIKLKGPTGTTMQFSELTNVNGTLFFQLYEVNNSAGIELWKSNGTSASTVMVKDIYPGSGSSYPSYLTNVNGTLYFYANDGANGAELWKSDGTNAGTVMVKDIKLGFGSSSPQYLTNVNGTLFFSARNDGSQNSELWKSDGTDAGTVMVKEINTITFTAGSKPENLTAVGGKLYFTADDGIHGFELWKSDGTEAGTTITKDIRVGADWAYITALTAIDNFAYFSADDGTHGDEIWKSDGTANGTAMVQDLTPAGSTTVRGFTKALNSIFAVLQEPQYGRELWVDTTTLTLPIGLTSFSATKNTGGVALAWTSIPHASTRHFTVQRSTDGRNYTSIGTVAAKSYEKNYTYYDAAALQLAPILYYRLLLTDVDGGSKYSAVAIVKANLDESKLLLQNNPVSTKALLNYTSSSSGNATIKMVDMFGKIVFTKQLEVSEGGNQIKLYTDMLAKGFYVVQLSNGSQNLTVKMVKD